jgi:hypothetical protein
VNRAVSRHLGEPVGEALQQVVGREAFVLCQGDREGLLPSPRSVDAREFDQPLAVQDPEQFPGEHVVPRDAHGDLAAVGVIAN